ncbi:MAG: thymidine phosphorylase family protein [Wenzhouxiangellaceae bacterium]
MSTEDGRRAAGSSNRLRARCLDLQTRDRPIAVLREDSPVVRAEGFAAHARILVESVRGQAIATLYPTRSELLSTDQIGLSDAAWKALDVRDGDWVDVRHPPPLESMRSVRAKIRGHRFRPEDLDAVVRDVVAGRFDDIELAMFLTTLAAIGLDDGELEALTRAMVEVGERLDWAVPIRMDKHCIGGLPGNRTTPLVVAIVAANGLVIPKTSSRAITSPAGTADTMETLAPVNLDLGRIRRVVEAEGGCVVWGGAVRLSPADDLMIRVARVMDLDPDAQLVASVLSKKIAAGATHVVLDLPWGPTAKVTSETQAMSLAARLTAVGHRFGLELRCVLSDGRQPVGRGIGPALEAHDVLAVLNNRDHQPVDLRQRAVMLAGVLLEMGGRVRAGEGAGLAEQTLASGAAWRKFQAICEAQGGMRTPPVARWQHPVESARAGVVQEIDNRRLARVAKLAGAPASPAAGVQLGVHLGDRVESGDPLMVIHAETPGELEYALAYAMSNRDLIVVADEANGRDVDRHPQ